MDAGQPEEDGRGDPAHVPRRTYFARSATGGERRPRTRRVARARTALVLLRLEALRHMNALESIAEQLNDRKGRP